MITALLSAIICLQPRAAQGQSAADIYKQAVPSVMSLDVRTKDGGKTGTAFLIDKRGIAATAWHVMSGARSATAKFSDGQEYEVSGLIDKDVKRDVAIIRVKVSGRPYLELATQEPPVGAKAFAIGSPRDLDFSLSEGIVSQVRTLNDRRVIQFTSPVSHGSSGGPLVDETGKVIGVVDFDIADSENLNFAVPSAIVDGLDSTLPTQPLDTVKAEEVTADTALLDPDKLGIPTWDGTLVDKHGYEYNYWKVLLVYRENAPAVPENVAVGLVSFADTNTSRRDMRGISLESLVTLRNYIKEFLDTNAVKELKDSEYSIGGKRFTSGAYVFSDRKFLVKFVHRGGRALSRPRWSIDFVFEQETRSMDQERARSFLSWMDEVARALKESGIDLENLKS